MFQRPPKLISLDTDDWIYLRIKILGSTKDLGGYRVSFQLVGSACQRFLYDERKKIFLLFGSIKFRTGQDLLELLQNSMSPIISFHAA